MTNKKDPNTGSLFMKTSILLMVIIFFIVMIVATLRFLGYNI